MEKLKPCPFCGCEIAVEKKGWFRSDTIIDQYKLVGKHKDECVFGELNWMGGYETQDEAIEAWNRRAKDVTYEQAHKFLEDKQREMTKNRGLYNEIEISINGKAIEAVEKQIPKKVIFESDGYSDGNPVYDLAECPKCGFPFEDGDGCWESTYCPNCGQRLDWEDE